MIILELAKEFGLNPVRASSTNGGEYKSPCPECGGDDRFRIWPNQDSRGRYWCRQCQKTGDAIQFCCDFMRMNFRDACTKVNHSPILGGGLKRQPFREKFSPKEMTMPSELWRQQGMAYLQKCHHYLLKYPHLLDMEKQRGLTLQSIIDYKLGWNEKDIFEKKETWGMERKGESQLLCLPKGIVIPSFRDNELVRIKVRRHEWDSKRKFSKYQIISGSMTCPILFGNSEKPLVIVESELDAILIQQIAGDICGVIALGGVGMKPDVVVNKALCKASVVLCALDFDEAGKKGYLFWRSTYQQLRPWPVPRGKSPGDAYSINVDLRQWIELGIEYIQKVVKSLKRNLL
jgi:DNA primase